MTRQLAKDLFGWGFVIWLVGYILGFVFFAFVPPQLIGWYIMPIGIALTLWVLRRKIAPRPLRSLFLLGIVWTLIAVIGDYLFIVRALAPADGYYKLDVYLYYALTLLLPLLAGRRT